VRWAGPLAFGSILLGTLGFVGWVIFVAHPQEVAACRAYAAQQGAARFAVYNHAGGCLVTMPDGTVKRPVP
jgi:hypothetical protein